MPQSGKPPVSLTEETKRRRKLVRWVAGVGVAVLLLASVGAFFQVHVCDQQVTSKGQVVRVCRHLQASDPPVIAVAIALLAGLSVFFTEISGLGITLKRQVTEAAATANEAQELAVRTQARVAETASDLVDLGQKVFAPATAAVGGTGATREEPKGPEDQLQDLIDEYKAIRLTMKPGSYRTRKFENVVQRMQSVLSQLPNFDVAAALDSADAGLRLAGYSSLSQAAQPALTDHLVDSLLTKEDKPFGQMWALRAILAQCAASPRDAG
jgi:hypothetical protein